MLPQLTTPCNIHVLSILQINGPPESPWQPDRLSDGIWWPAQIMLSVTFKCMEARFLSWQVFESTMGSIACCNILTDRPGCCIFPQPETRFRIHSLKISTRKTLRQCKLKHDLVLLTFHLQLAVLSINTYFATNKFWETTFDFANV